MRARVRLHDRDTLACRSPIPFVLSCALMYATAVHAQVTTTDTMAAPGARPLSPSKDSKAIVVAVCKLPDWIRQAPINVSTSENQRERRDQLTYMRTFLNAAKAITTTLPIVCLTSNFDRDQQEALVGMGCSKVVSVSYERLQIHQLPEYELGKHFPCRKPMTLDEGFRLDDGAHVSQHARSKVEKRLAANPNHHVVARRRDAACALLKLWAWSLTEFRQVLLLDNDVCLVEDPRLWMESNSQQYFLASREAAVRTAWGINSHFILLQPSADAPAIARQGAQRRFLPKHQH